MAVGILLSRQAGMAPWALLLPRLSLIAAWQVTCSIPQGVCSLLWVFVLR